MSDLPLSGRTHEDHAAMWVEHVTGVQGGRSWHLFDPGKSLTLCGKRTFVRWVPGYRNHRPPMCSICAKKGTRR